MFHLNAGWSRHAVGAGMHTESVLDFLNLNIFTLTLSFLYFCRDKLTNARITHLFV